MKYIQTSGWWCIRYTLGTIRICKIKTPRSKEERYGIVFRRNGKKKVGINITRAGAKALLELLQIVHARLPIEPVMLSDNKHKKNK